MLNVGLRAYLWEQKSQESKLTREFWNLNDVSYVAYRNFVSIIKDHGMTEVYSHRHTGTSGLQASTDHDDSVSEVSASTTSSHPSVHTSSSFNLPGPDPSGARAAFAQPKHMFDVDCVAVTAIRFARSGEPLLAMGLATGSIRIGSLEEPQHIVKELQGHRGGVSDMDWSADNLLLLSAGQDGSVIVWNAASGQAVRAVNSPNRAPVPCARFHPVNANLYIVGHTSGSIVIFNCSTGLVQQSVDMWGPAMDREAPVAMCATPSLLCVADSQACLHTWRCEFQGGQLQPLSLLARCAVPKGVSGGLTTLEYIHYCKAVKGAALLTACSDGSLCIWALDTWTGRPKVKARGKMLQAEGQMRVSMNTLIMPNDPQYIAVGAQDNAIEIFDISDGIKKGPKRVARLTGHASTVRDVCWSCGSPLLASADSMGTVIVWERQYAL